MDFGKVVGVLKNAAPIVANIVGGPAAGKAVSSLIGIAEGVTGKKGDAAIDAIVADPNMAMQFELAVMANEKDLLQLMYDDVKDARNRDIEVRKLNKGKNLRADIIAYAAIGCFIALLFFFFYKKIDPSNKDIALILIGELSGVVATIYAYEFGSSRGSKEKTNLLGKQ